MKKLLAAAILLAAFQFFPQTMSAQQFDYNWVYAQYSCHQGNHTSTVYAQSDVFTICHEDGGADHIGYVKQYHSQSADQAAQAACGGGTLTLITWGGGPGPNEGAGAQARAQADHDQFWKSRTGTPVRAFFVPAPYSGKCR